MVALNSSHTSWLLNELEFFGNADIHLECMGNNVEDLFGHLKVEANICFGLFMFKTFWKGVVHGWILSLFESFSKENHVPSLSPWVEQVE
jgi:hypothetical protein